MSVAKLTIQHELGKPGIFSPQTLEALFNPTQLSYSKSVTWSANNTIGMAQRRPGFTLQYQTSAPETLTVELFFDTYATATGTDGALLPLQLRNSRSVLPYTDAVVGLARIDPLLRRPPVCRLRWGESDVFLGILQQATRTLQMFLPDGTPVRATVNCTFMEYPGDPDSSVENLLLDVVKQYTIRPGDTLMGIASSLYGDPSLWRRIAKANRIENPARLVPGQRLSIPGLR